MRHMVFAIGVMVGLSACGSEPEKYRVYGGIYESSPIFAVLGGNRSCNSHNGISHSPYANGVYDRYAAIERELRETQGVNARFVVTCYADGDSTVYYATSDNRDAVHSTKDQNVVANLVSEMYGKQSGAIFVLGYSYGGWLTMRTAANISQNYPLAAVATIDPISRVDCTYARPFGCRSAPRDFARHELERISSESNWWSNFYQNRTWYLQSSSIGQASANGRINATHYTIATHGRVWGEISDLVDRYR